VRHVQLTLSLDAYATTKPATEAELGRLLQEWGIEVNRWESWLDPHLWTMRNPFPGTSAGEAWLRFSKSRGQTQQHMPVPRAPTLAQVGPRLGLARVPGPPDRSKLDGLIAGLGHAMGQRPPRSLADGPTLGPSRRDGEVFSRVWTFSLLRG